MLEKSKEWQAKAPQLKTVDEWHDKAKSPLSGAKKHPVFRVALSYYFDTTNVGFAYIESE